MTPAGEWATETRTPYRRLVVSARTGATHALSKRRRFGHRITLCGRPVESGWSEPRPVSEGRVVGCGQCLRILEEGEG